MCESRIFHRKPVKLSVAHMVLSTKRWPLVKYLFWFFLKPEYRARFLACLRCGPGSHVKMLAAGNPLLSKNSRTCGAGKVKLICRELCLTVRCRSELHYL